MKKEFIVKIIDEDFEGNGIARIDNKVIFIPKALKDEEIKIKIKSQRKKFDIGEIIEIITPSSRRISPLCKNYFKCGACNYQHLTYEEEINKKKELIRHFFPAVNDFKFISNKEYEYRNKITLHVKNNLLGLYLKDTNELIPFDGCNLISERQNIVANFIKTINLKDIIEIVIKNTTENEILVNVKGNADYRVIDNIRNNCEIKSIYHNDRLVYGKDYLIEKINNYKFLINHENFLQVNTKGMIKLYDVIKKYGASGNNLLDLYCGTGTIGIYLNENFKHITGIDIGKSNITIANLNKEINNITNIEFIEGDSKIATEGNYDVVIIDPPRSGLSSEVIKNLLNINSSKIVYVSCNPRTLKRDLLLLNEKYELKELTVVDMFPRTKHIECVFLLHRKK